MSEDMRDAEGTLMTAIERALHEADDCRAQWPLHPHMWHRISFPTEEMRVLLDAARAELAQHAALVAAVVDDIRTLSAIRYDDPTGEWTVAFGGIMDRLERTAAGLAVQPAASVARGEGEAT